MICLENVSKTFLSKSGKTEAVRNVSLRIETGEIFGIIGFSGAGKSTLVRCMNLLEVPTQGKITVDGRNLSKMSGKELRNARKKIGMIFQHFNLMASRTVFENISYPLKKSGLSSQQINGKVRELLKLVGMEEKEKSYPSQLSGGQKQRAAIARALANDPTVLLCDEATSALDPQTTHSILQLLKKLNDTLGITIVVITHEMGVVKEICDRVAVMENGNLVEEGDVFHIFANPQQEVTKKFIQSTFQFSKIYELLAENSPVLQRNAEDMILYLTYVKKDVSEPLISELSRKFEINLNIIFSSIEIIGNAPLGGLIAIASGSRKHIKESLSYLEDKMVRVEVIADGVTEFFTPERVFETAGTV